MKKIILLLTLLICTICSSSTFAQSTYKTAVGLGVDFGDGSTIVGPSIKHFFNPNNAIVAEVLFSEHFGAIGAYYQYHQSFKETKELKWYLGLGSEVFYSGGDPQFAFRPMLGLDYKIKQTPLSFTLDWRPLILIDEDLYYGIARFGIGVRYTYK